VREEGRTKVWEVVSLGGEEEVIVKSVGRVKVAGWRVGGLAFKTTGSKIRGAPPVRDETRGFITLPNFYQLFVYIFS
jgi:hypothetical protein